MSSNHLPLRSPHGHICQTGQQPFSGLFLNPRSESSSPQENCWTDFCETQPLPSSTHTVDVWTPSDYIEAGHGNLSEDKSIMYDNPKSHYTLKPIFDFTEPKNRGLYNWLSQISDAPGLTCYFHETLNESQLQVNSSETTVQLLIKGQLPRGPSLSPA